MTIAFVHNKKALLPGITAYRQFFSQFGIQTEVVSPDELGLVHRHIEWHFMGKDLSKPREGIYKIHEYASASVPPFAGYKNWIKSFFNTQPDFRLFQNEYVKNCFNFRDSISYGFREVGIPSNWLLSPVHFQKEFDFIYIGSVDPNRNLEPLLEKFTKELRDRSLLVVSQHYEDLQSKYSSYSNIQFKGPVDKEQVRMAILKSRFALNYIPNLAPFNQQTSTKLLEYCTCRIPIITTSYPWVKQFEATEGGRYFYLNEDLSNLDWEVLNQFEYDYPDLRDWTWDLQIRKSGVLEFIEQVFPEVKF